MKKLITVLFFLSSFLAASQASACTSYVKNGVNVTFCEHAPEWEPRLTTIDGLDLATTAIGVTAGFVETNPLLGIAGDKAAPLVGAAVKLGIKHYLKSRGASEDAVNHVTGSVSAFGAGNNTVILLGAASPVGLAAGGLAAFAYYDMNRPGAEKDKTPQFQKWHGPESVGR